MCLQLLSYHDMMLDVICLWHSFYLFDKMLLTSNATNADTPIVPVSQLYFHALDALQSAIILNIGWFSMKIKFKHRFSI